MLRNDNNYKIDLSNIANQLNHIFTKVKITDQSVNKIEAEKQLNEYYTTKFSYAMHDEFSYDFVDLFCGAGGLSIGLEHEGFRPVAAIDKDKSAIATYKFNRPWLNNESIIHDDIKDLKSKDAFPHVPLVVGGPPCQGFSIVNKHKKENDERNELYKFYVHSVSKICPEIFLIENVDGILKIYDNIKDDFAKIGYITCAPIVINTRDFGFPQNRKRAFILGINNKYINIVSELYYIFIHEINSNKKNASYTLWDAISDLPALKAKTLKNSTATENKEWGYTFAGFTESQSTYLALINKGLPHKRPILNHRTKYNNDRDIQIYNLLKPGEKSDARSIQKINPYKSRAGIFRDKFDKLLANEPCKTITAHMYYDCNMYIHPFQARGLTPREAARVQGFPDDYLFLGTPNEWYRQIGNAVSPLMAQILGKALKKILVRIYNI